MNIPTFGKITWADEELVERLRGRQRGMVYTGESQRPQIWVSYSYEHATGADLSSLKLGVLPFKLVSYLRKSALASPKSSSDEEAKRRIQEVLDRSPGLDHLGIARELSVSLRRITALCRELAAEGKIKATRSRG